MKPERRKAIRASMRMKLTYTIERTKERGTALTTNISKDGVRFTAEHTLELGTTVEVTMHLPEHTEPIRFVGSVVWSKSLKFNKREQVGASDVGVVFVSIDPKEKALLTQYATMYGFSEGS